MNSLNIVSALTVATGAALIAWHVAEWRAARDDDRADQRQRQFAWRRFRRRLQASGIVAVVGVLLLVSQWITDPATAAIYWLGVLLLLLWMMALAVGDAISSRNFFRAVHRRQIAEQIRFQADSLKRRNNEVPAADGGEE